MCGVCSTTHISGCIPTLYRAIHSRNRKHFSLSTWNVIGVHVMGLFTFWIDAKKKHAIGVHKRRAIQSRTRFRPCAVPACIGFLRLCGCFFLSGTNCTSNWNREYTHRTKVVLRPCGFICHNVSSSTLMPAVSITFSIVAYAYLQKEKLKNTDFDLLKILRA